MNKNLIEISSFREDNELNCDVYSHLRNAPRQEREVEIIDLFVPFWEIGQMFGGN